MKIKLYCVSAISGLCLSAGAFAGDGGVAGSVAINLDAGGNLLYASTAVAVGKTTAYAGAVSTASQGEAFAVGSGGVITLNSTAGSEVYVATIAEESVAGLAVGQDNSLDESINIDAAAGT
ncbi:secreted protein, partial [Candidatus Thiomargarita nelsonii]